VKFNKYGFLTHLKIFLIKVGDGTTSVSLFAAELLKEVKSYIEEGVSPQTIIKGFRKASQLVSICCNINIFHLIFLFAIDFF